MTRAAKSVLTWGIYLVVTGFTFLLVPNLALPLLGFPTTNEVWIRLVGVLVIILGYYFIRAAQGGVVPFYRWSIHARFFLGVCASALVLLGLAQPMLLLFAVLDWLSAVWTWWALRTA